MRAGEKEEALLYIRFLKSVMRKEGKPFPWMFIYDGTTFLDDSRDFAPLAIAAQCMVGIRYYEYFRDTEVLRNDVFPILKRCCDYAVQCMFSVSNGKWILSLPISNDVVEEEGTERNQTFTALWFAVLFKKACEYASVLGVESNPLWKEIYRNLYLEHDSQEYYHCKGYKAEDFKWASWIPFLLYPSEGCPFLIGNFLKKRGENIPIRNCICRSKTATSHGPNA